MSKSSFIGDSGVVEKKDLFGHIVIVVSIILIGILITLGTMAIISEVRW